MINWTQMNADLQDKEKFSCLKNRKKEWGMSFDLRISEQICVLKKEMGRR